MKGDPHSHGLWEASAPPPPPTPPLSGADEADVVIIGAGYTGLSAALHLSEGGARVTVLEAEAVGFGGSGRNVGLVNAGLWVLPEELPRQLGPVHGPRLLKLLGDAPSLVFKLIERHGIACEAVRHGTLHCAADAAGWAELQERCRQWQAHGAPVELLDTDATRQALGSSAYRGSLLDRRAGTIQPLAYARGLARAALNAGARLHTASPVQAASRQQDRWRVQTPDGQVDARWLIVATNAYSSTLWPELQEELVRLPFFNLATRPLSEAERAQILPNREGVWDTRKVLTAFRYDQAGRMIFGSIGALRGLGARVHGDWGRRALARVYPALRDIPFEHAWYGQIGTTANAMPRLHALGPQALGFCGYNGRGIAPGTALGRELARRILGDIDDDGLPLPVTAPEKSPLKSLREACYEYGALAVHTVDARLHQSGR